MRGRWSRALTASIASDERHNSAGSIQAQLDAVFATQESNQFGPQRYALMFKPGTYAVNANVGFYTSVGGLGKSPAEVTVQGVTVDAGWFGGNATQNFWRSVENLTIAPPSGFDRWAVAQAAPMRRVSVLGDLNLAPSGYGWASGGYIADSKVSGIVQPYSQQQWFTRDSQVGGWLASASTPRMKAITEVPPMAIHLRVSSSRSSGPKVSMPT